MNFGQMISSFFTTAGPGGVVILVVVTLAALIYITLIRWIMAGGQPEKKK